MTFAIASLIYFLFGFFAPKIASTTGNDYNRFDSHRLTSAFAFALLCFTIILGMLVGSSLAQLGWPVEAAIGGMLIGVFFGSITCILHCEAQPPAEADEPEHFDSRRPIEL